MSRFLQFILQSGMINKDSEQEQEVVVEGSRWILSFGGRYSKDFFFLKNNSKGSKIVNSSENSKQLRVLMTSASRGWVK